MNENIMELLSEEVIGVVKELQDGIEKEFNNDDKLLRELFRITKMCDYHHLYYFYRDDDMFKGDSKLMILCRFLRDDINMNYYEIKCILKPWTLVLYGREKRRFDRLRELSEQYKLEPGKAAKILDHIFNIKKDE